MDSGYHIEIDDLATGLTRPATKLGVPFVPFFLSIMVVFFAWMFYQGVSGSTNMMSVVIFVTLWSVIYAVMFMITSKDLFGLVIYWVNHQHFNQTPSRARWGNTDSYQP